MKFYLFYRDDETLVLVLRRKSIGMKEEEEDGEGEGGKVVKGVSMDLFSTYELHLVGMGEGKGGIEVNGIENWEGWDSELKFKGR